MLSNKSQFVGQVYVDISLGLRACEMTYFTTGHQTLLLNKSVLQLIYFLT